MVLGHFRIFGVLVSATTTLVGEEPRDHVVLRTVKAPVVDKLTDDERQDRAKTTHVCDQIEDGVTASRVNLQVPVALYRDFKLGGVVLLVAPVWKLYKVKDSIVALLSELSEVKKFILQDQLRLRDHEGLGHGLVRVNAQPDSLTLPHHSLLAELVRSEVRLIGVKQQEAVLEIRENLLVAKAVIAFAPPQLHVELPGSLRVVVSHDVHVFFVYAEKLAPVEVY